MPKSDPNLLTQAEYARARKARGLPGGSREAVRKAVDEKRISVFGPDKLVDQQLADSQWERNTRARFSPQASGEAPGPGVSPPQSDLAHAGAAMPTEPAVELSAKAVAPDTGYSGARARREIAEAEKAEVESAKLRGAMVMRQDVDRAGFEIGREIRDAMESSVNSLAAELAVLTTAEACVQVIRRHNRAMQELLAKAFREKIGAPLRGQHE